MNLRTASETLSFIRELEEKAAKFYENLAKRSPENETDFLAFAKENRKYNKQIQMAYQSVITDAIEGCYAFNLNSDDYEFETALAENATYADALAKAIEIEDKILDFYHVAADQSMSLLADVPRNFKIVAKKRKNRIPTLKSFG
jgi:rubrerythrin